MKKLMVMAVVMIAAATLAGSADAAELKLGAPFCDNAILQREMKVPVWGWTDPGAKVTVEFAGQKKSGKADKDGKFMIWLDPLKASFKPRTMTISSSISNVKSEISNVLVGEVWMASGQSNMQSTCTKSTSSLLKVEPAGEGKVAPIREFEVTSVYAMLHPIEKATGAWKNGNYGDYSAIAFAFAQKIYEEIGVPIGILNCSFSMTAIQAWVPRVGFRDGKDEYTQNIYKKILLTDPTTPEHKKAWGQLYKNIETALKEGKEISTARPGNMSGNRDASWLFNGRMSPVVPYAIRGAIWNQGYANSGEGLPYYNNLHSLCRGWRMVWDRPDLPVYFHQFYSAGVNNEPSIGGTAEMRLGTWLARDIPNADMASQIDITGGIHYHHKVVPGQRLALHALKNQYGKKVIANGPMYKSYTVKGDKVVVEFDNADGGLVVAETGYNAIGRHEDSTGFANPRIIPSGDDKVKLFYVADKNRVWYPASVKIDGDKAIVSSPKVKKPCGVTFGTGGIGWNPNLYNKALLPLTPFIVYDNEIVTSKTWPDEKLKIDGEKIDPSTVGLLYEWRKMPILSVQFRENAVLQAGVPVPIWGSTQQYGEWGGPAEGDVVIHFEFGDIKKTIPVTDGMDEWKVVLPPRKATAKPTTLKVTCTINGELAHERIEKGIVFGDVFYVSAPPLKFKIPQVKPSGQIVRMIENQSKRSSKSSPSRYSVCVSRTPRVIQANGKASNRFASYWKDASGLAAVIGNSVAARTGNPVGIIYMQSKKPVELKSWVPAKYLNLAPSLMDDYKDLAKLTQGNDYYAANARVYVNAWKKYWGEYIPEMMKTKAVPDGIPWGTYPSLAASVTSTAGHTYNVETCCFTPAALKGIVFAANDSMVANDQGALYGEQVAALGNAWLDRFDSEDACFFYMVPGKALAPKIGKVGKIKGKSESVEVSAWGDVTGLVEAIVEKCD